jgi:hypothetical protein
VATPPPTSFSLEEYPRREEGSVRVDRSARTLVAYHEGLSRVNHDLLLMFQLVESFEAVDMAREWSTKWNWPGASPRPSGLTNRKNDTM